jgi:hypothetical protein
LLMNMGQMMEAEFPGETEVPDENPAKNWIIIIIIIIIINGDMTLMHFLLFRSIVG